MDDLHDAANGQRENQAQATGQRRVEEDGEDLPTLPGEERKGAVERAPRLVFVGVTRRADRAVRVVAREGAVGRPQGHWGQRRQHVPRTKTGNQRLGECVALSLDDGLAPIPWHQHRVHAIILIPAQDDRVVVAQVNQDDGDGAFGDRQLERVAGDLPVEIPDIDRAADGAQAIRQRVGG